MRIGGLFCDCGMPLVTCRSNIFATERSYPLRVAITHTLSVLPAHLVEYEDPKAGGLPVRLRATTIPPNLDVRLPGSQLVVRIHGFICGKRVESKAVAQSGLLFEFNRFVLKVFLSFCDFEVFVRVIVSRAECRTWMLLDLRPFLGPLSTGTMSNVSLYVSSTGSIGVNEI